MHDGNYLIKCGFEFLVVSFLTHSHFFATVPGNKNALHQAFQIASIRVVLSVTPMFELENVTVRFGQTVALHNVSLTFPSKATTVLLGTSGSGKSTALRLLLGLIDPVAGIVRYTGRNTLEIDRIKLRREIGFMTQDGGLFPHLTLAQNICLVSQYLRWPEQKIRDRLEYLLSLTRLEERLLASYPHQVSGGQRQRAALMRALMLDPTAILLDEPLGALDPITRFELQNDLKEVFEKANKTVVLVTHDLREAAFLGNTIHILHEGCLIQSGRYREMLESPANEFVSRFFAAQRLEAFS
ncbi:MAG: ATP-binding cassette domain-containing protein [Leptospirales bacterium]|nr:ATP-binding cassette domain-containing protein [Leptospirales bacterium]